MLLCNLLGVIPSACLCSSVIDLMPTSLGTGARHTHTHANAGDKPWRRRRRRRKRRGGPFSVVRQCIATTRCTSAMHGTMELVCACVASCQVRRRRYWLGGAAHCAFAPEEPSGFPFFILANRCSPFWRRLLDGGDGKGCAWPSLLFLQKRRETEREGKGTLSLPPPLLRGGFWGII